MQIPMNAVKEERPPLAEQEDGVVSSMVTVLNALKPSKAPIHRQPLATAMQIYGHFVPTDHPSIGAVIYGFGYQQMILLRNYITVALVYVFAGAALI